MVNEEEEPVNLGGEAARFAAATADVPDTLGSGDPKFGDMTQAEVNQPAIGGLTVEALELTFGMGFAMIAGRIGEDGKFWELQDGEKKQLASVWHPVLAPLWAKWIGETDGAIVAAVLCTVMTVAPRLVRDNARRASRTASTATAKSGDSFS
jgi:hypothetical protein